MSITLDHPLARSRWGVVILASLVVFGPLGIDLYLPAMPAIGRDFGVSPSQVQWSLTAFLLGFCVGMLIYGPVSDAYGRRPVLLFGSALFMIVSFACALASDAPTLIGLRFLQAVGGGAASVMSRTIVRDIYPRQEMARMLSLVALATAVTPMLAPLAGGLILQVAPWRAVFLTLGAYGAGVLILSWRAIPESHPADRRAGLRLGPALMIYGTLLRDRVAWGCVLCGGGIFAAMFAYIAGTPFVYIDYFGVSPQLYGVLFGVNIAAQMLGAYANSRLIRHVSPERASAWAASASLLAALALAAAAGAGIGGLAAIAAPLMVIVGMTVVQASNMTSRIMGLYPDNAGAAAAALTSSMFGLGAVSSLGVSLIHDGSPQAMSWVILVCCLASLAGTAPYFTRSR